MSETIMLPSGNEQKTAIIFNKSRIQIIDSYKVTKTSNMKYFLKLFRYCAENRNIKYSRTIGSWIREWKAHNVLYKLKIFRSMSRHTCFDENESLRRRFVYFILSLLYWK